MYELTDEELIDEVKKRIKEKADSLEEQQRLNEELLELNKKLEESESLKSHFISNITNEIINPFTSILGLAKSILEVKKEDWKKVISMVALIHSEAFNLDFQLKNIFVAAKIEAGEIFPEIMQVDIPNMLKNLQGSFRVEAQKKSLSIQIFPDQETLAKEPVTFCTDPEKLKLIVSNLMSNAIKFSYEGGKIEIKYGIKENILSISVKDYGTGLSETNQKIIFDRFKRLDSGINSINRGHGLGLSIIKALIDLLNGEIEIKSQINEGADFTVKIPESTEKSDGFASDGNEFIFDADNVF